MHTIFLMTYLSSSLKLLNYGNKARLYVYCLRPFHERLTRCENIKSAARARARVARVAKRQATRVSAQRTSRKRFRCARPHTLVNIRTTLLPVTFDDTLIGHTGSVVQSDVNSSTHTLYESIAYATETCPMAKREYLCSLISYVFIYYNHILEVGLTH